jgi:hypothetical protein
VYLHTCRVKCTRPRPPATAPARQLGVGRAPLWCRAAVQQEQGAAESGGPPSDGVADDGLWIEPAGGVGWIVTSWRALRAKCSRLDHRRPSLQASRDSYAYRDELDAALRLVRVSRWTLTCWRVVRRGSDSAPDRRPARRSLERRQPTTPEGRGRRPFGRSSRPIPSPHNRFCFIPPSGE